jgi:hypothetical protein
VTEMTNANQMTTAPSRTGGPIAWWAYVLAAAAFVFFQVMMNVFLPREHNPPPPAFRIFLGLLVGIVFAGWMLLVGYVHNDAARRGMNKWLWTAVVLFIPNAIGFILYLLTRKQLLAECPNCHAAIQPTYRFCPKCATPRLAVCGHCNTPIMPGDQYCNNCGRMLHEPMK